MPEPILLPDGSGAVTSWDQNVIEVTGNTGQKVRIARAAAPPALEQTVKRAEMGQGGPATLVPTPQGGGGGGAFDFVDINTPGPGVQIQQPGARVPPPTAPAVPDSPAPAPVAGAMSSPLAAYDAEIARLRAQPRSGGGTATRTATSTTRIPDAAAEELRDMQTPIDESVAEQQIAIEQQGDVEAGALGEAAKLHAQQGRRIEQEITDQTSLRADYEKRFSAEQQKLAELNQRAQVEIDPKRYWKNKDTGDKILATIGMALGAFAEGFSRGAVQNRPLQMIQTAIQRDIDAQLENRNRAERDVTRQAGIVGLIGDKYTDDLQKRQAAMVLANEAVAKQIDGIAAGMQSEQAQAKAAMLSAQLRQVNAQQAQAFAAQIAGSETTQTQSVSGGGGGGGSAADKLSAAVYGPGATYDAETYIPGSMQVMGEHRAALNKSDQVEINKLIATNQAMLRKMDQIEALAADGAKLSPQKKTQVTQLYNSLLLDIKTAEGLGALDAGATEVGKEILGPKASDITSISTGMPQLRQMIRSKGRDALRNRTRPIDPTTIPLAARHQGGGSGGQVSAAPASRPLAEEAP